MIQEKQIIKIVLPREKHWVGDGFYVSSIFSMHSEDNKHISPFLLLDHAAPKYFPFIATIFFFILACNLIGMIPGSYTITSQLVVTGVFATGIFILTLFIGFAKHGLHFFGILVPPGVPKVMIPLMIPIEIISMIARPVSLSVRLFANMTAGHTILYVLFGLAMSTPLMIGWLPFGFTVAINGLEIAIAFIQAYIFTILTCVYIGDVIHLH